MLLLRQEEASVHEPEGLVHRLPWCVTFALYWCVVCLPSSYCALHLLGTGTLTHLSVFPMPWCLCIPLRIVYCPALYCLACHIWFYGKNSPWLGPRARAAARAAAGGGASSVEVNGDSGGAPAAGVGEGDAATIGDEGDAAPVAVSEAGGSGIAVEEGSPNDPVAVSNT